MNLAYRYPIIYWNCACLSVDSSAINSADFYNLIEDEVVVLDDEEKKKVANKMDYAKLADALDKFKNVCEIELPDINRSRLSFTPDVENNSILYGLKGITRVTDPVIAEIMNNRPYASLDDFLSKVTKRVVTKDKVINLIKCGAFNKIESKDAAAILNDYIWSICGPKNKLTMQNANMLIDYNLLPLEFMKHCDVYKLTKELRKHRDANKLWYAADNLDIPADKFDAWKELFAEAKGKKCLETSEIVIDGQPHKVIDSAKWDRFYEETMVIVKGYIVSFQKELLDKLNDRLFNDEYYKYCSGDDAQWELDSMNFYFHRHPLDRVIPQMNVHITPIQDIVEGAQDGQFVIKGKVIPKMKLYSIAGTVIDKDKVKGLVTIQCPSGVVNIKIYKDLFATMNNTIGDIDENGDKEIEQDSFFEKGTHLLVTGIQRGATFVPKVYKNSGVKAIMKIVLDDEGDFVELEEKI